MLHLLLVLTRTISVPNPTVPIILVFGDASHWGLMAAWELWEKAVIPSLLSGAGTWFGLVECKKAVDLCDKLQNFYWRVMLSVPESCPKLALRCET